MISQNSVSLLAMNINSASRAEARCSIKKANYFLLLRFSFLFKCYLHLEIIPANMGG